MNEDIVEHIREVVKELPFDLRAELVVTYMRSRGINPDDIILSPLGLFKRKYNSDIHDILVLDTKSGKQYVQLKLNREGIYDGLPQAMTHSVKKQRRNGIKNTTEMIEEVKVRRQEEKAARTFFQPFENEFYQQQVDLELEEQNILKGYVSNSRYSALLNKFWQLPEELDVKQKATFIYLIPLIHKATGDMELTRLCYEAVLGVSIDFEVGYGSNQMTSYSLGLNDHNLHLGVNFICGMKLHSSMPVLKISIGPLEEEQLIDFLPAGRQRMALEYLNGYFIEAGLNIIIILDKKMEEEKLTIGAFRIGYSVL